MKAINATESEIPFSPTYLVVLIVLKCFCFVCGVLGNLSVIIYNLYVNNNKTQTSYFVTNLALADLLTCLSVYPIWAAEFAMILYRKHTNQVFLCKFTSTVSLAFLFASSLTLLSIALDRYLFISRPLKYPLMMTWKGTYGIILSIWICALLFCPVLAISTKSTDVRTVCFLSSIVLSVVFVIYILTPLILIFYFNFKILKLARVHLRRIQDENNHFTTSGSGRGMSFTFRIKREMKTINTFAIVVGAFVLCLLPFSMVGLLESIFGIHTPLPVSTLLGDLALLNSILNPIIYGMRHNEYKNYYRQLLGVICR